MTFDDKLDKILLSHGAEQGELHYSLKQAVKDLVLSDVVGENKRKGTYMTYSHLTPVMQDFKKEIQNELLEEQRLIINGKESGNV